MLELNSMNGAGDITYDICNKLLERTDPLFGCEMGVAWGGGIERKGMLWHGRGIMWGFDTFEGHPKQIGDICPDTVSVGGHNAHATYCMDPYYRSYGTDSLQYGHIRSELDQQNLHNVILVKGLISENTDISFIPHLHYVLLDMDFPLSMKHGYEAVKNKIVSGGFLCLHDVVPKGHIHGLYEFYCSVVASGEYDVISENDKQSLLAVLRKK